MIRRFAVAEAISRLYSLRRAKEGETVGPLGLNHLRLAATTVIGGSPDRRTASTQRDAKVPGLIWRTGTRSGSFPAAIWPSLLTLVGMAMVDELRAATNHDLLCQMSADGMVSLSFRHCPNRGCHSGIGSTIVLLHLQAL